jgi:hypothetical protein
VGQSSLGWQSPDLLQAAHALGACLSSLDDEKVLQLFDCQLIYRPPIRHRV